MKSFLAACGSMCALAFAVPAQAMPIDAHAAAAQPAQPAASCRPAPGSAPWAITFCNPGGRSRGVGTGGGKL